MQKYLNTSRRFVFPIISLIKYQNFEYPAKYLWLQLHFKFSVQSSSSTFYTDVSVTFIFFFFFYFLHISFDKRNSSSKRIEQRRETDKRKCHESIFIDFLISISVSG